MNEIIKKIEAAQLKESVPEFHVGDTVRVYNKIKEGARERIQVFEGTGSALVKGVLGYAEPVKVKGLNLLSAPGNDLVASTALAVSGAHIVLFTTGRGTPFASPVPTVKISSNSKLAGHKDNWIDFNAGRMVEDKTKEEMAQALFDYVLEVASGRKVKAEEAGFHDMAIFKQGVTL